MLINLPTGIDNIAFGMTEPEIIQALGMPDRVVVSEFGNRDLLYFAPKIALKIEPTNTGRLGLIEIHNRNACWNSLKIWSVQQQQLLAALSTELAEQYILTDYGHMESFFFKRSWVELQYEFGELYSFNFGVRYDENDQPIWPRNSA